jgi:hypothetical protein
MRIMGGIGCLAVVRHSPKLMFSAYNKYNVFRSDCVDVAGPYPLTYTTAVMVEEFSA